ncbi:hypothetical protein GE09DRAFT_1185630 [Coniochaeta sp. 2T2.1]|nr:hypothetical protein GE09DRAFT_1185630 [Coniochaeta sp. 2T2.1]
MTLRRSRKPQMHQNQQKGLWVNVTSAATQPNDFTSPRLKPKSDPSGPVPPVFAQPISARLSSKPPNPNPRNAHPPPSPSRTKINQIPSSLPNPPSLLHLFDITEAALVFLTVSRRHSDNSASTAVKAMNTTAGSEPQANPGVSDETTAQQFRPEPIASSGGLQVELTVRKKNDDTMNKDVAQQDEPAKTTQDMSSAPKTKDSIQAEYINPPKSSVGFTNEFPDLFEPSPPTLKHRPTDSRYHGHIRSTALDILKRYGRNSSKLNRPSPSKGNRPSPFTPNGKDEFMGFAGDTQPDLCGFATGNDNLPGTRSGKPTVNPPVPVQAGPSCRPVTEADILLELRNLQPAPSTTNAFSFPNEDRPFSLHDLVSALEQAAAEASPFNDFGGVCAARKGPAPRVAQNDDADPTCAALPAAVRSALAPAPVTVAEEEKVVLSLVYGEAKSLILVTFSKLAPMAKWHATAKADAAANPDPAGEYDVQLVLTGTIPADLGFTDEEARDAVKSLIRAMHVGRRPRGRLSAREALASRHMDAVLGLRQEWKCTVYVTNLS